MRCSTVGFFQDVTMRLIADHILPPSASGQGVTYLQGEVSVEHPSLPSPQLGHSHHVYVSKLNEGASAFICEMVESLGIEIRQTPDVGAMASCDCMLLYLTSLTWTRGTPTSTAFAAEVQRAMETQVPLLLAHESTPRLFCLPDVQPVELPAACLLDVAHTGQAHARTLRIAAFTGVHSCRPLLGVMQCQALVGRRNSETLAILSTSSHVKKARRRRS